MQVYIAKYFSTCNFNIWERTNHLYFVNMSFVSCKRTVDLIKQFERIIPCHSDDPDHSGNFAFTFHLLN